MASLAAAPATIPDNSDEILSRSMMRALREAAQIGFREIAVEVDVSAGWLCAYEQGRARLRADQLRKIKSLLVSEALRQQKQIAKLVARAGD
jgi:transcriptional regulator with XRE-family HTH domain